MDLGLTGRRAAVAAATGGLGFAVAQALAEEGAEVTICGHHPDRTAAAAARIGHGTRPIVADLTSPDECERFVQAARDEMGGVDILVTNTPGPPPGTFSETALSEYPKALDLSLLSVVRMCAAAVPDMQERRWGRIVAITSIAVRQPIPNLVLSNTARAGATGFLKTLAREVAADGITVNSLQPGLHDTERLRSVYGDKLQAELDQIPARTVGRPSDFGAAAAFLCSDQARYITGTGLPIAGGADQSLI